MLVTADPTEFMQELQPGDVIVFDVLANVSGLIQWADRASADHAALVTGPDTFTEANLPGENGNVITDASLSSVLGEVDVRGMTALRPALDEATRARLIEVVEVFRGVGARFDVLGIAWLAPAALMRSYGPAELEALGGTGDRVLMWVLQQAARAALRRIGKDRHSLTCSEFVYRCLTEAGLDIEVPGPLHEVVSLWPDEVLDADADNWAALEAHNEAAGWPVGLPQSLGQGGVRPDFVTPGDLWRSPSLTPVAVLTKGPHRPA